MSAEVERFLRAAPKAELHLHIEGTLEPELLLRLAERNRVPLRFKGVGELRRAYEFTDLQSFLDIYYEGAAVLRTEEDFSDLAWAYLERAAGQGVRHAEVFFDPQTHTGRGVPFRAVIDGLDRARARAQRELGVSSRLILCFLRHMSEEAAQRTLDEALPFFDRIVAVGLDSSEAGHPPAKFERVFARARGAGLLAVAHAGEEGPPDYIRQALDLLQVRRVDHGVRCLEDPALVDRLRQGRVPLTVCPLSNVKLRVFPDLKAHNLKRLLAAGLCVTVNSDDPAYFGGYLLENLLAVERELGLTLAEAATLLKNGFEASFLSEAEKGRFAAEIDRLAAA